MNRLGRSNALLAASLIAASVLILGVVLAAGCNRRIVTDDGDKKTEAAKADPWETVSRRLHKETDLATCKTALGQLNNELSERSEVAGSATLPDEAARALQALIPLSADDLAEIRQTSYSSLDPAYLADGFYLLDAARSLDPTGLPPAERARVGFDWVCRQVFPHPWTLREGVQIPAIPPTYSLRRGSGSGLDRAYVFLALLQQMGLDGCLIGPPDAGDKPSLNIASAKDGTRIAAIQKGPFWAVGVRIGADILLFEPWRGEAFPGPNGQGVGTLAQVKANPDQLKLWFENKTTPWDVKPEDVKKATVVLSVPLSSLSPRMALLEDKIKAETGVHLAINPAALRARFTAAAPDGPGLTDLKFWNPPGDRFDYCRSLIAFLPLEEGGLDRAEPAARLHTLYLQSLFPPEILNLPADLKPEVLIRLRDMILGFYGQSFFISPSPRERIQRGRLQDAARDLTDKLQEFGRAQERLRTLNPGEIEAWCEAANAVYENLYRKRYPNIGQVTALPDTDPDVAEARGAVEDFWRDRTGVMRLIVDRSTAGIGRSEASFLLALAKHEEAERMQLRVERPGGGSAARVRESANDAWHEAANAWSAFLEQNNTTALPARTAHAKALAARARKMADAKLQ
ncbi:MAG TPA: hypothetical protein VGL71_14035 [Urbifossiella sp.]